MSEPAVWIDGSLVAAADRVVPFDDRGLSVGDGVFETVKLVDGEPFAFSRHLRRLRDSAAGALIPAPAERAVRDAVDAVRATAPAGVSFLRITLTAGRGPLATFREVVAPTLIVAIRPGDVRVEPTDVALVPWRRNERGALVGVKSTSYGENVVALAAAGRVGASEALFANTAGDLCEGTGSCVFVGFGDELLTPPLSSGCLAGVTRALLLAGGVGREAPIPLSRLAQATEMFLASTSREVQPVRAVHTVGGAVQPLPECPGPLTEAARTAWTAIATTPDP